MDENDFLRTRVGILQKSHEKLQEENEQLLKTVESLRKKLERLIRNDKASRWQAKSNILVESNEYYRNQIRKLNSELDKANSSEQQIKRDFSELLRYRMTLEQKQVALKKKFADDLKEKNKELDWLKRQNKELNKEMVALKTEHERIKSRVAEKDNDDPQRAESPEDTPEETAKPSMFHRVGRIFMDMYQSGTLRYWVPPWIF